ncbi:MAG: GGDEF domain-containing protein, partial [Ruminococcus sp.]|nr:GGDEF domain-containing protein [Ruminococcus sp.]
MNKRFNVCLLVAKLTDIFSNELVKGAIGAARELDINLTVIPGNYIGTQEYNDLIGTHYEYQYNVLFDYAARARFDYVIAAVGTIAFSLDKEQIKQFLKPFDGTPVLCVASPIDGYDYLGFDNSTGIASAVKYLADNGRKHIGILSGNPFNNDCVERFIEYRKALEENGLEFKDSYKVDCALSNECTKEAEKLLDDNPELDAVLCANDLIAAELYKVLHARNIIIGKEIAVVGFDDQPSAKNYDPPLATVKADARLMGRMSVEKAVDFLKGEPNEEMLVSTRFIPRNSCYRAGAMAIPEDLFKGTSDEIKDKLKKAIADMVSDLTEKDTICSMMNDLIDFLDAELVVKDANADTKDLSIEKIKNIIASDIKLFTGLSRIYSVHELIYIWLVRCCKTANIPVVKDIYSIVETKLKKRYHTNVNTLENSHVENIFIRDSLTVGMNLKDSYAAILKRLCDLGSQTSYLYLLDKPVIHNYGFDFPEDISWQFKSYSFGANTFSIPENEQKMYTPEVFKNSFLVNNRPRVLITSLLFTGSTHYGLALLEPDSNDLFKELELITYQLSSAVRTLDILRSLNDHLTDINDRNTELETESRTDELTRTYNRKGFYAACDEVFAKSTENDRDFVVCYADTDNIKLVNHSYGHVAGDFMIKLTSDCLRHAFGKSAVIGRMGGGEFGV